MIDDKVWPTGIEYQIRYNHTNNHTGDLIKPNGANYLWFPNTGEGESATTIRNSTFLHPNKGGEARKVKDWLHHASVTENFHGLDDKWNRVEIIVMGDQYSNP